MFCINLSAWLDPIEGRGAVRVQAQMIDLCIIHDEMVWSRTQIVQYSKY